MKHLLIAGTNRAWVWTLAECLCGAGYAVETAKNGLDCLDRIRATHPCLLVLSDELLWGGSDGVLDYLNEERNAGRPTVLFVAASAMNRTEPDVPSWVKRLPASTKLQAIVEVVLAQLMQETPSDFASRLQRDAAKLFVTAASSRRVKP